MEDDRGESFGAVHGLLVRRQIEVAGLWMGQVAHPAAAGPYLLPGPQGAEAVAAPVQFAGQVAQPRVVGVGPGATRARPG
ncbi:hypothetical protein AV521_42205 [Streptomyces sp. IMTB 2501]|nr:hypothetical protein AV521_42205 [Streptomyces sp. IMTB 2501]